MKHLFVLLSVPVLLLSAGILIQNKQSLMTPVENHADTTMSYTVVELFTSEGCSSCPAADRVLAGIGATYKNRIIVLGFHVDYWNRLGWKDRFSAAAYSQRQQQYASSNRSEQVYTPQAIVNGKEEMVGSDKTKLTRAIENSMQSSASTHIRLSVAEQKESHAVEVVYSFDAAPGRVLNIALLQPDAVTEVRAGENNGLTLHHVNVVRDFKTVADSSGTLRLMLPENVPVKDCRIVGYVQDKNSMRIMGATSYITAR
ncbi:MAG: DUF1223 domain-containing protein [Sediminibacterium sp.]